MVDKSPLTDRELDDLFAVAQNEAPLPPADLVARILADAEQISTPPASVGPVNPKPGWLAGLIAGVGGWPAMAGLVTAAVTGVTIGVVSPETVDSWTGGYVSSALGYEVNDLLPSVGDLLEEG